MDVSVAVHWTLNQGMVRCKNAICPEKCSRNAAYYGRPMPCCCVSLIVHGYEERQRSVSCSRIELEAAAVQSLHFEPCQIL